MKVESKDKQIFDYAAVSITGTRNAQEDSFYASISGDTLVCILCDGMGGLSGGKIASETAIRCFLESLHSASKFSDMNDFFLSAIDIADETVFFLKGYDGKKLNAGTTMVAALLYEYTLLWMSVGDSRIYIYRGNELLQLNKDHTYKSQLDEMKERNIISEELYNTELSKSDALVSYIGMGGVVQTDICANPISLEKDDVVLLASDGVYKTIDENEIVQILCSKTDSKHMTKALINKISDKNLQNQDNASAILIKVL